MEGAAIDLSEAIELEPALKTEFGPILDEIRKAADATVILRAAFFLRFFWLVAISLASGDSRVVTNPVGEGKVADAAGDGVGRCFDFATAVWTVSIISRFLSALGEGRGGHGFSVGAGQWCFARSRGCGGVVVDAAFGCDGTEARVP